jgi:hypothetical protein
VAEILKLEREVVIRLEVSAIQKLAVGIWDEINKDPLLRDTYGHLLGDRPMEPSELLEYSDLFDPFD